jgi:mannose-6-phosphate isomerase
VPGGLPHAIGEGVTMIEIMEPSDWVVRCEFEREGIVVPPEARFMGRDLDFCLDIFDYTRYDAEAVRAKNRLKPETLEVNGFCTREKLAAVPNCFTAEKLTLRGAATIEKAEKFLAGVVCEGEISVSYGDETITVRQGECFFAGANCEEITFRKINITKSEVCLIGAG